MTEQEKLFLDAVKKDVALGSEAAQLVENLIDAQTALRKLSLTQRLKLVSLATLHSVSHVRIATY